MYIKHFENIVLFLWPNFTPGFTEMQYKVLSTYRTNPGEQITQQREIDYLKYLQNMYIFMH